MTTPTVIGNMNITSNSVDNTDHSNNKVDNTTKNNDIYGKINGCLF